MFSLLSSHSDLCFFWDSIGSIPCKMSVEQNKNNPMWNAGAVSQQFGNFINQRFPLSRKESSPYTNSMVAINKIWVAPAENMFAQPKMKMKNGETMFLDASIVLTFGNITNSGTSKLKATKDGKEVEFAVRTKVAVEVDEDEDPIIAKAKEEPKSNYSLKAAPVAKVSKADKFDALFDDEDESEDAPF